MPQCSTHGFDSVSGSGFSLASINSISPTRWRLWRPPLQQGIELFAAIAEIHITTVAERNHAITQIRLEAQTILIP